MTSGKTLLRFVTTGSVDDGKSTLIGRLLFETNSIPEDQLESVRITSLRRGQEDLDLSLLLDGLAAEREQFITIDVAYRHFSTSNRKFIIADCPGHEQYTRNMVSGASTADLAIILIDARKGILTQSKRHGFLISLLGVPHLIVAVNKMDLVGYDEEVFRSISGEYSEFSQKLGIHDMAFVPISALLGDNITTRSTRMPWYNGQTLLHSLENVRTVGDRNLVDFRFPVQYVIRPNPDFRGYAGRIVSGTIRVGEQVALLPSGKQSSVKTIVTYQRNVEEAAAGESVVLTLSDDLDIRRGDMLVRRNNLPELGNEFDAMLCWMHDQPMKPLLRYVLKHTTRSIHAYVSRLLYRVDVNTLHRTPAESLSCNEIGRVQMHATHPLFYDPYRINRGTGSFILIDPVSNCTVAAGMIRGAVRAVDNVQAENAAAIQGPKSSHIAWHGWSIDRDKREKRGGHKAAVIWLTGYSGSGKSTVADALEKQLFERNIRTMLLDGDNVRHGLCSDLGFSDKDRTENLRRVGEVAKLFFENGMVVICSFISPLASQRRFARGLIPPGRFFEIYVRCNLDVCKRRDPRGLYRKAAAGEIPYFTGVSLPYEEPQNPDMVVDTDLKSVDLIADEILCLLTSHGIIPNISANPPAAGTEHIFPGI